jgi:hypothetical protein
MALAKKALKSCQLRHFFGRSEPSHADFVIGQFRPETHHWMRKARDWLQSRAPPPKKLAG